MTLNIFKILGDNNQLKKQEEFKPSEKLVLKILPHEYVNNLANCVPIEIHPKVETKEGYLG